MAIPHSPPSRRSSPPSTHITRSLPYRHVRAVSHNSSTTAGLTGTKRGRPGTTPAHRQSLSRSRKESSGAHSYITPSSSEDELDDSFEDSDSDSDDESCCGDQPDNISGLSEDHRFQQARQPLLRLSLERVREFISIAQYTAPPDSQEPPHKRSRSADWQPECTSPDRLDTCTDNHSDQEHADEFVVISPPRGNFHFSCPFYASNPQKHRRCLLQHDLLTLKSAITHTRRHHMRPPYCPICSSKFDSIRQCDAHIIKRECELRELVMPEGINYYQKARLEKDDRPHLSNAQRWERLNATVFPDQGSFPSPFLSKGLELQVSMARDYWKKHGRTVVSDFLKDQGMLDEVRQDDGTAQAALCQLTLESVLSEMMEEHDGT